MLGHGPCRPVLLAEVARLSLGMIPTWEVLVGGRGRETAGDESNARQGRCTTLLRSCRCNG
jgi:hypothetical protein